MSFGLTLLVLFGSPLFPDSWHYIHQPEQGPSLLLAVVVLNKVVAYSWGWLIRKITICLLQYKACS